MGKKFSIKSNPTFPAKVKWPVVGGDPVEIDFTFNYLGREALAEYQAKKTEYSNSLLEMAKLLCLRLHWTALICLRRVRMTLLCSTLTLTTSSTSGLGATLTLPVALNFSAGGCDG